MDKGLVDEYKQWHKKNRKKEQAKQDYNDESRTIEEESITQESEVIKPGSQSGSRH